MGWFSEYNEENKEWRIYNGDNQIPPLFILRNFGDPSDGAHLVNLLNAYSQSREVIRGYEKLLSDIINNAPQGDEPPKNPWAHALWFAAKKAQSMITKRITSE